MMRNLLGWLLLLVAALSVSDARPIAAPVEARDAVKTEAEWSSFPPYPGARFLCSQHVLGQPRGDKTVEIIWWSYASTDDAEKVVAYYLESHSGSVKRNGKSLTIRRNHSTLSISPSSTGEYPTCGNKPRTDEKTIMIVSVANVS